MKMVKINKKQGSMKKIIVLPTFYFVFLDKSANKYIVVNNKDLKDVVFKIGVIAVNYDCFLLMI